MFPNGFHIPAAPIGHLDEKYSKFAYSSKYGFSVRKASDSLENMAPDSELVFKIGNHYFGRTSVDRYEVADDKVVSVWSPFPGIEVTSTITPNVNGHTRNHTITSNIACTACDCGYALPSDSDDYVSGSTEHAAYINSSFGKCRIEGGLGFIISCAPNTSLLYPRSAIPAVSHDINAGETYLTTIVTNQ